MGSINNIPALAQIMAWRRPGDKPLSEPMMVRLLTHLCVTRPQWVNNTPTWGFITAAPGCQAIIWTHDVIGYRCITVTRSGFNGLPQHKPQLSKSSYIFARVWEKRTITILLTTLNIDSVFQNMWINKSFSISNPHAPPENLSRYDTRHCQFYKTTRLIYMHHFAVLSPSYQGTSQKRIITWHDPKKFLFLITYRKIFTDFMLW